MGRLLSFLMSTARRILRRPSIWVAIITAIAYYDETAFHGKFVYDDAGSIKNHPVVNGNKPLSQVWKLDYWGTPMSEPSSHKSFRPIVTLSFRYNWLYAEWAKRRQKSDNEKRSTISTDVREDGEIISTYGFHVVNYLLHIMVTFLATEVSRFVFVGAVTVEAQIITGLIFGLHPVHVEAVTNITSRSELFMSLFALLAFWMYAHQLEMSETEASGKAAVVAANGDNNNNASKKKDNSWWKTMTQQHCWCIYVLPWLCMILSVLCKEQGATTLVTCVVYEFIQYHDNVQIFLTKLWNGDGRVRTFSRRVVILGLQSLLVALWRIWLNGDTRPDFINDQNPAGFATDRFTRIFSVSWVYVLYIWDAIFPANLCPDWSGLSIDLITSLNDPRAYAVLALWMLVAASVASLVWWKLPEASSEHRRVLLLAFFAFTFSPFLLSSNLLVVVGLMKADRVIYLPLLGLAMMEAWLFTSVVGQSTRQRQVLSDKRIIAYSLVLLQFFYFCIRLQERNIAWSSPLRLWMSAYVSNPKSRHTIYNCGYELSLKLRYTEAEQVLRPIGHPQVEGPANTFVYAMVLYNLHRCDEAVELIETAYRVIDEKRQNPDLRNTASSLARAKSNLMVAEAYCTRDVQLSAQRFYSAVQEDPTNQYAVDQATKMLQRVEAIKGSMLQQR